MRPSLPRLFSLFPLLSLAMAATPAAADVTAVFATEAGDVAVEYRDDGHVRMRAGDGGCFIVREGKGYIANHEGGQWHVVAVDDMARWMGAARGQGGAPAEAPSGAAKDQHRLRDTGRSETVAGIRGRVYEYAMRDPGDGTWSHAEELVLSDHADAKAAYRGLTRVTELLGAMAGAQGLDARSTAPPGLENRAVLRYGSEWRLKSLSRAPIPDAHFTLPAEPMGMPGAPGHGAAPAADEERPHWATEEARGVGREAADEARRETRRGVNEGVREGIRGLFGR